MSIKSFSFCWLILCTTLSCSSPETQTTQQDSKTKAEEPLYRTIGFLEKLAPEFDRWVSPDAKIEVIAEGYKWSEGVLWVPEEQCLLFSDVTTNIAYKWTPATGAQPFLNPSGYTGPNETGLGSNGLALDPAGNLILCQNGNREVARLKSSIKNPKPIYETVASHYQGKRLNTSNDLVIDKTGNIYFTDPNFGVDSIDKELPFQGVYRIDTDGTVRLLTDKWPIPNGIGLSPDESKLYIANTIPALLIAYDLAKDGTVSNEKILFDIESLWEKSIAKQRPDGMDVNREGIIFLTGPDGVLVIQPDGKHLGTIRTDKLIANCTLNEDESVLYAACHDLILRVKIK